MTTPADTFAAFIAVLADALDSPEMPPTELADRLHLSRSHLDHLITATAGEAPVRLRRRILLERAGWRLLSSDLTVLEIAVEAGYGSHEAFSRAFAQAYGQSPTGWRGDPTSVPLPSPNGVHFHPPGSILLPGPSRTGGQTMIITIIGHHIKAIERMINSAGQLSEEELDRPIELSVTGIDDRPTIRTLLSRLVGQLDMWNKAMTMSDYDFGIERHESLDQLQARLERVGPVFVEHLRQTDDEGRWDDTFVDALCQPPRVFSYAGMVDHVLTYSGHRKTLVAGALADVGAPGYETLAWDGDRNG